MGFDSAKFVTSVADDKRCILCQDVLDNPLRSPCGHVFCSTCIIPWIDTNGHCPKNCRTLTPTDLENVLPLREVILNLKVRCEFFEHGCTETFRLTDLLSHTRKCGYQPGECSNPGCSQVLPLKDMYQHETESCLYRPVGECDKGCGLMLYLHTMDLHDCHESLKTLMKSQEKLLHGLEERLDVMRSNFSRREKVLVKQVSFLHQQLGSQADQFQKAISGLRSEPQATSVLDLRPVGDYSWQRVTLHRDIGGSLGFNIMGGYMSENNGNITNNNNHNNNNVPAGVVISRVTEGGVGDTNGIRVGDRILKVNGQDLSQSSHHEAVEAFRSAKEPIVVEVLRRTSKTQAGDAPCGTGSGSSGSKRISSRGPVMVSIGTQTEEDFYCYNRPPTPPPALYPVPIVTGLYELSSRRPVAFSPSAEMGLTDIEMAHNCDVDDPYFDDRQYEMVYEEVVLRRACSQEKLGLTLCYGSLEDELTDIFISEVDPYSVAGRDGRIRDGDQIVQINGVDVRSRSEAISLFSGKGTDISLTVARPMLQFDDGYMEEPNTVLDDLHMELLEKHHHDNMEFMASMLAGNHDEEGAATDTATESSSQRHEKDSGFGRTDESTRNEESCEQETDYESVSLRQMVIGKQQQQQQQQQQQHSYGSSFLPSDIPADICARFQDALDIRSAGQLGNRQGTECHLEPELSVLNRDLEDIQIEYQDLFNNQLWDQQHLALLGHTEALHGDSQKITRIVPRMGTRLEYSKHLLDSALMRKSAQVASNSGNVSANVNNNTANNLGPGKSYVNNNGTVVPSSVSSTMSSTRGVNSEFSSNTNTSSSSAKSLGVFDKERDIWTTTSAYNTGESCRSTPLTLELNPASQELSEQPGITGSMLCLATPSSGSSGLISSDTEKQTQTPPKPRDYSSEDSGHGHPKGSSSSHTIRAVSIAESMKAGLIQQADMGESLQDLYLRCADVMYTNRANLQHTMAVQQKLFQQQLEQQSRLRGHVKSPGHSNPGSGNDGIGDGGKTLPGQTVPSDSGQMEWVVKRRPDGTRYITRRPVRSKLLKERAKKISEERCGMTTDDDAMSEMKTGRYWSKEDRKRHLEKAKDYKKKKELLVKAKLETLKETEEKKEVNIVELSHRKMMKHKGKKVFDNFTTVKEMLAHGNKVGEGKQYNPLLSVTTV